MIGNYFCTLGNIFKEAFLFLFKNWKTELILSLLILLQYACISTMITYIHLQETSVLLSVLSALGGIVSLVCFWFMFKLFFNLTSSGLKEEKISNKKVLGSTLLVLFFNLIPPLVLNLSLYGIGLLFKSNAVMFILNLFSIVLSFVYWIGINLLFASVVQWKEKPAFISMLKSIKLAYQKFHYTFPVFTIAFLLQILFGWLLMAAVVYIYLNYGIVNDELYDFIYIASKTHALFLITPYCIGAQVSIFNKFLNKENKEK